jgi:hypothetical protein
MNYWIIVIPILIFIVLILILTVLDIQERKFVIQNELRCDEILDIIQERKSVSKNDIVINTWVSKECWKQ